MSDSTPEVRDERVAGDLFAELRKLREVPGA
jgi:hypothetical protein